MWKWIAILLLIILVIVIASHASAKIGAGNHYDLFKEIKDFCTGTKEGYANCEPRNVNTIEIAGPEEASHGQLVEALELNRKSFPESMLELVDNMLHEPNDVREIKGFYNIKVKYDDKAHDGDLQIGTYITHDRVGDIMSGPHSGKLDTIVPGSTKIISWYKGYGRENLHKVTGELIKEGAKYYILDAAGTQELVDLYERYGFRKLVTGYKRRLWENGYVLDVENNTLMIGRCQDVFDATK